MLNVIGHLLPPRYIHLVVHVGLHNHPSVKRRELKGFEQDE
jgi:hypothetical protein